MITLIFFLIISSISSYLLFSATNYLIVLRNNPIIIKRNQLEYSIIQRIKLAFIEQTFDSIQFVEDNSFVSIEFQDLTIFVEIQGNYLLKINLEYDLDCNCITRYEYQ